MIQMLIMMITKIRGKILERIKDKENVLCFDTHTKEAIITIIEDCCRETAIEEIRKVDQVKNEGDVK